MNKIIKLINEEFNNFLNELFEANVEPYPWTKDTETNLDGINEYYYEFTTADGDKYFVDVENYDIDQEDNSYWTVNFNPEGFTYEAVLNKGRLFNVMSTIIEIINDFIQIENPYKIRIIPSKTSKSDNRRFNIYLGYIKAHLPTGYTLSTDMSSDKPEIYLNRV